jgi:hypothetical protein
VFVGGIFADSNPQPGNYFGYGCTTRPTEVATASVVSHRPRLTITDGKARAPDLLGFIARFAQCVVEAVFPDLLIQRAFRNPELGSRPGHIASAMGQHIAQQF